MANSIQAAGGAAQVGAAGGGAARADGEAKGTEEAPVTSSTANYFQHGKTSNGQLSHYQIISILQYLPQNEQNKVACSCKRLEQTIVLSQPSRQRERLDSYIEFIKSSFPEKESLQTSLSEIQEQIPTILTPIAMPNRFETLEAKVLYFSTLKTDLKKKLINIKIDIIRAFSYERFPAGLMSLHNSYPFILPMFFEDFLNDDAFNTFALGTQNPDRYRYEQYCDHNLIDEALALFNTTEELISLIKRNDNNGRIVEALARNDRISEAIAWLATLTEYRNTYELVLKIAPKLIEHGHIDLVITYLDKQPLIFTSNEQRSKIFLQIFHTLAKAGELDQAKAILEDPTKLLFLGDDQEFQHYSKQLDDMITDSIPDLGNGRIDREIYNSLISEYQEQYKTEDKKK